MELLLLALAGLAVVALRQAPARAARSPVTAVAAHVEYDVPTGTTLAGLEFGAVDVVEWGAGLVAAGPVGWALAAYQLVEGVKAERHARTATFNVSWPFASVAAQRRWILAKYRYWWGDWWKKTTYGRHAREAEEALIGQVLAIADENLADVLQTNMADPRWLRSKPSKAQVYAVQTGTAKIHEGGVLR